MIAQHESPVPLLQAIGRRRFRCEPIIRRIKFAQLQWGRLRMQADQPAIRAFDNFKKPGSGAIKAIGRRKERARCRRSAGGTAYVACSEISLSEIRWRSSNARSCFGVSLRLG